MAPNRKTAGQKAAATRKRRATARKAARTRTRRAAGRKAAITRSRRAGARKAAVTRALKKPPKGAAAETHTNVDVATGTGKSTFVENLQREGASTGGSHSTGDGDLTILPSDEKPS